VEISFAGKLGNSLPAPRYRANILKDYFYGRVASAAGPQIKPGDHFVAVTGPGSSLERPPSITIMQVSFMPSRASADTTRCYLL